MKQPGDQPDEVPHDGTLKASWWRRHAGQVIRWSIGLFMLALAFVVVLTQREALASSWRAMRSASPLLLVLLVLLPLGNVLFTSLTFKALTDRYAKVPLWEMNLLMLSAGLLNYLPMRPGLVGRVAYHRTFHGIRATDSAKVVVRAMAASAISLAAMIGMAWLAGVVIAPTSADAWRVAFSLVGPVMLVASGSIALSLQPDQHRWRWLTATGWRWADMLIWAARYWVVFRLVGEPIDWTQATLAALISQMALAVPFVGNGLGLREWAVGVFAGQRAAAEAAGGGVAASDLTRSAAAGLTADLVNRAAELMVLVPLGACAGVILARRSARRTAARPLPQRPSES